MIEIDDLVFAMDRWLINEMGCEEESAPGFDLVDWLKEKGFEITALKNEGDQEQSS